MVEFELGEGVKCGWFVPNGRGEVETVAGGYPLVLPVQTHTSNIGEVEGSDMVFANTDGLIVSRAAIAVGVRTADCVPIVVSAGDIGAVAAVHAGWRGTIAGILPRAIERLKEKGADVGQIKAVVGPCICCDCYEIDSELAGRFVEAGYNDYVKVAPREDPLGKVEMSQDRPHLDLAGINRRQLMDLGVHSENIIMSGVCTRHSGEGYPSWRRVSGETRRLITWIVMTS